MKFKSKRQQQRFLHWQKRAHKAVETWNYNELALAHWYMFRIAGLGCMVDKHQPRPVGKRTLRRAIDFQQTMPFSFPMLDMLTHNETYPRITRMREMEATLELVRRLSEISSSHPK